MTKQSPTPRHITVPLDLAEYTEAMFRSVDPRGAIAQRWSDALANARSQPAAAKVPEGWRLQRWPDPYIVVSHPKHGTYAASDAPSNIASAVLYHLADDLLGESKSNG